MKIAYFSESPADQAALAIFAEGILGEKPEPVVGFDLEAHGVGGVISALDGVIRGLHYNSDADALIVVVDCDDTEPHKIEHNSLVSADDNCRLCKIEKIIDRTKNQLKPRPGRPVLKIAIGLAVPAIEAWYLVGKNHEVGEARWQTGPDARNRPFDRPKLKLEVYGTDRPSIELETKCAVKEATRIITNISSIEAAFPVGFGLMANEIRSWTQ